MKHIVISALLTLASISSVHAYQFELEGGYGREDVYVNDIPLGHVDVYRGQFNVYFSDLSEQTEGPIALRPFLSRSSSLSFGYSKGEDDLQLNGEDLAVLPTAGAEVLRQLGAFEAEIGFFHAALDARNLNNPGAELAGLPFSTAVSSYGYVNTSVDVEEFDLSSRTVLGRYILDLRYAEVEQDFSNTIFTRPINIQDIEVGFGAYVAESTSVVFNYRESSQKGVKSFIDPFLANFDAELTLLDQQLVTATAAIIAADPGDSLTVTNQYFLKGFGSVNPNNAAQDFHEKSYELRVEDVTAVDGDAYAHSAFSIGFVDRDDFANSDGLIMSAEFDYYFNKRLSAGMLVEIDNAGIHDIRSRTFEFRSNFYVLEQLGIEARYVMTTFADLNVGLQTLELEDSDAFYVDAVFHF